MSRQCESYLDELKAYADGELSMSRRMSVRAHVARCAACREEITAMEQMGHELKMGDAGGLDAGLKARILAGVPEGAGTDAGIPERKRWRPKPLEIWAGVALAVIAWFVLMPVFSQSREQARSGGPQLAKLMENRMKGAQDYDESLPIGSRPSTSGGPAAHEMRKAQAKAPITLAPEAIGRPADTFVKGGNGFSGGGRMEEAPASPGAPLAGPGPAGRIASATSNIHAKPAKDADGHARAPSRAVKKTADITVEVDKLEEKSDSVETMVRESGGYVANNKLNTEEDGVKTASLEVKVPVNTFESILNRLSKLGDVKAKSVTGEDLTEQMSDEKEAEKALGDELADAKNKLKEARTNVARGQAERLTRDLRIEIAQANGRLEILKKEARLSTITVNLRGKSKKAAAGTATGGFMDDLNDTGKTAVSSLAVAARIPLVALIWLVAYAPVWIPLLIAYKYALKANQKRMEVKAWQAKREGAIG